MSQSEHCCPRSLKVPEHYRVKSQYSLKAAAQRPGVSPRVGGSQGPADHGTIRSARLARPLGQTTSSPAMMEPSESERGAVQTEGAGDTSLHGRHGAHQDTPSGRADLGAPEQGRETGSGSISGPASHSAASISAARSLQLLGWPRCARAPHPSGQRHAGRHGPATVTTDPVPLCAGLSRPPPTGSRASGRRRRESACRLRRTLR